LGYGWTPGPPLWWVIGFYASLAIYVGLLRQRLALRWFVAALAAWLAVGSVSCGRPHFGLFRGPEAPLVCTFLSVGHGTSVVVEFPDGRVMMYDAGRMGLPGRAVSSVSAFLWSRGITHLDAVILSHPDTDHYNALPGLLERFSVGVVYVSPVMFEDETPTLVALRSAIRSADVRLEELHSGHRLRLHGGTRLQVLHPPQGGLVGSDNANSVVVRLDHASQRILLAGDLEPPGLDDVLAELPLDCDVLLAPHHGSLRSNPQGFAAWCQPEWVIVSGAAGKESALVQQAYARAGGRVFHTADSGAVQVTLDGSTVRVRGWRDEPW
jgi:competence protein ComEC